ncbi:MAG: hypothetical protein PHT40_02905 [Patescibacteria group bacterium]|nr:hypothetical protein [Patescibacteria group bacterium]
MSSKEKETRLTVGEKFLFPIIGIMLFLFIWIFAVILFILEIISLVISLPIDLILAIVALLISFNKFSYPEFGKFPITKIFWKPLDWTIENIRKCFSL